MGGVTSPLGAIARAAIGAVVALDHPDARQRRPVQMALGVLHLGDPGRVGVGLQRRHGDAERRGAFGRPLMQLISGPPVGVGVDLGHRVAGRRWHAFGDGDARAAKNTRRP